MGNSKFTIDIDANISKVKSAIKESQKALEGISSGSTKGLHFEQVFDDLISKSKRLKDLTSKAMSPAEAKEAYGLYKSITRQNEILQKEIKATKLDPKKMIPTEVVNGFKKCNEQVKEYEDHLKAIEKAQNQISKKKLDVGRKQSATSSAQGGVNKVQNVLDSEFSKAKTTKGGNFKNMASLKKEVSRLGNSGTDNERYKELSTILEKCISLENKLSEAQDKLNTAQLKEKSAVDMLQQYENNLKSLGSSGKTLENLKNDLSQIMGLDFSNIDDLHKIKQSINGIQDDNLDKIAKLIELIEKYAREAGKSLNDMDNNGQMRKLSEDTSQFSQEMKNMRSNIAYFFGLENAIQLVKNALRDAFETVKELDAAMTETAVVTDFSVGDMWNALPQYTAMANKLGATILGAYETTTLFYQQGLKTNEVMQVSEETMKMARIAGMDYVEATNMMTAALRGFNMAIDETSAKRVNDVYSELAAITASDTQEISSAMTKTASIAHNANMEFETTSAFLSQIIETTREAPETAGTALKTIIARFQELKKSPMEIGEVDGEGVDANKIETALKTINVPLRDTNGQFRDLDDVFLDIAGKWDTLDMNTQRYIATMAAGSRQQSRFIAMMSNYDRTLELVDAANNSAGASQEQFGKTTKSLESKLHKLKNAYDSFVMGIANSSLIKEAVDFLTFVITSLDKITSVLGNGLPSAVLKLLTVIGGIKGASSFFDSFFENFTKIRTKDFSGKMGEIFSKVDLEDMADKPLKSFNAAVKTTFTQAGQTIKSFATEAGKSIKTFLFDGTTGKFKGFKTVLTNGFKGIGNGIKGIFTGVGGYVAAAAAAIAAIVIAIKLIKKHDYENSYEGKTDKLNAKTKEVQDTAQKAKQAYDDIFNAINNYNSGKTALDGLVQGTDAWYQKLLEVNQIVLDLIQQYPELGKYLETDEVTGALSISAEGTKQLVDRARERAETTQQAAGYQQSKTAYNSEERFKLQEDIKQLKREKVKEPRNDDYYKNKIRAKEEEINKMTGMDYAQASSRLKTMGFGEGDNFQALTSAMGSYLVTDENGQTNTEKQISARLKSSPDEINEFASKMGVDTTGLGTDAKITKVYEALSGLTKDDEGYESSGKKQRDFLATYMASDEMAEKLKQVDAVVDNFSDNTQKAIQGMQGTDKDEAIKEVQNSNLAQDVKDAIINQIENAEAGWEDIGKTVTEMAGKYGLNSGQATQLDKFAFTYGAFTGTDSDTAAAKIQGGLDSLDEETRNALLKDFSFTEDGMIDFVKTLEAEGVNIQETFGMTKEALMELGNQTTTTSDKVGAAGGAYVLAAQISAENLTALSEEQFAAVRNMSSQLADGFQQIGDKFYYVEGSANDLAMALTNAANTALGDYQDKLNGTGVYNAADMAKLTDEEKEKNFTYDQSRNGWVLKNDVKDEDKQVLNAKMNYTDQGLIDAAVKTEDFDVIDKNIKSEEERRKAYNALAQSYGVSAAQLKGLTAEQTKNIAIAAKQKKTITDSTKSIKDYVTEVKNSKKAEDKKNAKFNIANELNTMGGADVADDKFVTKHMADIEKMANGDVAAANRVKKAWVDAFIQSKIQSDSTVQEMCNNIDFNMKNLSSQVYKFKMTGEGDFTDLTNKLLTAVNTGKISFSQLENYVDSLEGMGLKVDYEYEYSDKKEPGFTKTKGGKYRKLKSIKIVGNNKGNGEDWTPSGVTETTTTGGSSSKTKTETPEAMDKLYNLIARISKATRMLTKYQDDYNRALKDTNKTYIDINKNVQKQLAKNKELILSNQKEISSRKSSIKSLLNKKVKYTNDDDKTKYSKAKLKKYVKYDSKSNLVTIDWKKLDWLRKHNANLFNVVKEQLSTLEGYQSDIEGANDAILDAKDAIKELEIQGRDSYIDLEQRIYDALVDSRQKQIDKLSDIDSSINTANSKLMDSIQKNLNKIRQDRDNKKTEKDIAEKERRLAYLKRDTSTANVLEIKQLEEEIADQKESYTDSLIDQKISELQEQNDKASEERQQQIDLLQSQLDYTKESGELWDEVHTLMANSFDEITGQLKENSEMVKILQTAEGFSGLSEVSQMKWLEELTSLAKEAKSYSDRNELKNGNFSLSQSLTSGFVKSGQKIDVGGYSGTVSSSGDFLYNGKAGDKTYFRVSGSEIYKDANGNWQMYDDKKNEVSTIDWDATRSKTANRTYTIYDPDKVARLMYSNKYGDVLYKNSKGTYLFKKIGFDKKLNKNTILDTWSEGLANYKAAKDEEKQFNGVKFATGGLADYTGPAWLDGTKSKPELVLNAQDTENFIMLKDILGSIMSSARSTGSSENSGDNYYEVNINVDKLENDYDVDKVAERVKKIIVSDSRYRNVNAISKLR